MKFTVSHIPSGHPVSLVPTLGAVALAVLVASCGGGGKVTDTGVRSVSGGAALRPLPPEFSAKTAVNYGPYRKATVAGSKYITDPSNPTNHCFLNPADRANEVLTDDQVLQDLNLLVDAKFGVIRLFESSDNVAQRALRVIKANNLSLKVVLSAAIDNYTQSAIDLTCGVPTSDVANEAEIARTVKLANDYPDIVVAVSVGNEKMMTWATTPVAAEKIAGYIKTVRGQIKQPVTADENWAFYANATNQNNPYAVDVILGAVDFVSMHTYPILDTVYSPNLWDWRQQSVPLGASRAEAMMSAAVASAQNEYTKVRTYLDSKNFNNMPIVIGETGWKARDKLWGRGPYDFRAHPVNQSMYLSKLTAWANVGKTGAGPKAIFYFDAFDEPWKQADDKWGLFDVKRQARYAAQQLNPSAAWPNGIETIPETGAPGIYTPADAVYWSKPIVNAPVSTIPYTLYSDTVTVNAPTSGPSALNWYAWDKTVGNTAFTGSGTSDGKNAIEFVPNPSDSGWGMFFGTEGANSIDLSAFANGYLEFDIKTKGYPGSLEFGFVTNSGDNVKVEAYKTLSSGMNGYVNDGAWHHVSIQIADLVKGNLDTLSKVMHTFVIADRFKDTGKPAGTTGLPNVYVDKIYISPASPFTLYSDTVPVNAPTSGPSALNWYAWDKTVGNTAFTGSGTSDGKNAIEFVPNPSDWGWGMFFGAGAANSINLSAFANGHLQFDIKTNAYPGSLEFGFVTNSDDNVNVEAYKALSSGMDGYVNDGAWHHVSIPIADLFKGNVGKPSMVMHAFVIADRFKYTGKPAGTTGLPNVYVDKIYISKD